MLQYDRRSAKNQTKNFLAINKNSVKNKAKQSSKKENKEEEQRKKPRYDAVKSLKNKPRSRPLSSNKPSKDGEETVTISKDYLEKLLKGNLQSQAPPPPPVISITDHSSEEHRSTVQHPSHQAVSHVVYDHNQIPGLAKANHTYEPTIDTSSHIPATATSTYSSADVVMTSFESPRGGGSFHRDSIDALSRTSYESPRGGTYHRGTTDRPVHPAMRSQIVFGDGPGWGGHDSEKEREEAKRRWMSELADQMKAQNVHNPMCVTGRGGDTCISVGLQEQKSPKELTEKKLKDLEHREFLLAQIEEKRRKKEQEKLRIEREAMEDERKRERERERLSREFEMEKELQRRKKIEEARKIAVLQERIKMAEQSAIIAKEEMKKSKKLSHMSNKHVAFQDSTAHQRTNHRLVNSTAYDHEPRQTTYIDDKQMEQVASSLDLRSPSLHTIPISVSQSDKSMTSPRSVRSSYEKVATKNPTTSTTSRSTSQKVVPTNSQISLYSSSSEEPMNAMKKRSKPKPDPPSSGKRSGPPGARTETRIPRRNILRKQLVKSVRDKSESESEGLNLTSVKRSGRNQQPTEVSNSVAKARARSGSSHKTSHHRYRPSSTESQDDIVPHHHTSNSRRRLTKAHSVPDDIKEMDSLPASIRHQSTSPPVPAVARRLAAQTQPNVKSNSDVYELSDSGIQNNSNNNTQSNELKPHHQGHTHDSTNSGGSSELKLPALVRPKSARRRSNAPPKVQSQSPPSLPQINQSSPPTLVTAPTTMNTSAVNNSGTVTTSIPSVIYGGNTNGIIPQGIPVVNGCIVAGTGNGGQQQPSVLPNGLIYGIPVSANAGQFVIASQQQGGVVLPVTANGQVQTFSVASNGMLVNSKGEILVSMAANGLNTQQTSTQNYKVVAANSTMASSSSSSGGGGTSSSSSSGGGAIGASTSGGSRAEVSTTHANALSVHDRCSGLAGYRQNGLINTKVTKHGTVSVLSPIQEVRSSVEMKESMPNKSATTSTTTSVATAVSSTKGQKELLAQLNKLRQGIIFQGQVLHSRAFNILPKPH